MSRPPSEMEPHHLEIAPAGAAAQELRLVSALVVILGAGLFMALPFVLSIGAAVFLPLVAAMMLSIVLAPLADRLAGLGLPNPLASLLALVVFLLIAMLLLTLILQPALDIFDRFPAMLAKITNQVSQLRGNLGWITDLNRQLARLTGHSPAREVVLAGPSVIEQLAFATPSVVLETLFMLLMTYFMIESRIRLRRSLLLDRSSFGASLKAARVIRDVQDRVAGYILTVGLINLGVGAVVALGAWSLGFEAPVMWGGLAFVLNFLPYIGPLLMIAVLTLFGLGTSSTLLAGLVAPAAYLGLHAIEANFVTPAILGKRFTLNPVLILLSISYFSWIWGVIGALLSVPILLTMTALFEHLGKPHLIGFLFGEPLFAVPPDLDED
jgi:predicted PurR-regulated permease PerM